MVKSKGRMPSLVKLFAISLSQTLIIMTPEGRRVTVHTDGSITKTSDKIYSILHKTSE